MSPARHRPDLDFSLKLTVHRPPTSFMRFFSFVALFGLLASSGAHLAVANGMPLPAWVFLLQVGVLALIVPLAGGARQTGPEGRRLVYWSSTWTRSPLPLLALSVLLIGYVVYELLAWLREPEGGVAFLKLVSSAWMCAYAIESVLLYPDGARDLR